MKKNKKIYQKTTRYDIWYNELVISKFRNCNNGIIIFNQTYIINKENLNECNSLKIKDLLKGFAIINSKEQIDKINS